MLKVEIICRVMMQNNFRQGAIEVAPEDVDALEEPLMNDLKKSDVSFSEESDSFPIEWEAVSRDF